MLKHVADADDAWRKAKKYERKRALEQAEERIEQFAYVRDQAVYDAVQAGVPKTTVGQDGLGTSNPHAVREAYDKVAQLVAETGVQIPRSPADRFHWGKVVAKDERWIYGWVIDAEHDVVTRQLAGDEASDGFFLTVDRANGAVTTIMTPDGLLTKADEGWEDVRDWAAAHANEA